ncbi:MAG: hypothetical protein N2203_01830 [Bacteroidia bacterium]|nr:hypothetical protein [Bacteroidia bacterium]
MMKLKGVYSEKMLMNQKEYLKNKQLTGLYLYNKTMLGQNL